MAAQLHLTRRGEVPQRYAAVLLQADKGRLRVLELRRHLLHTCIGQLPLRQGHAGLIAAEHAGGKRIHHIGFHKNTPTDFLIKIIINCLAIHDKSI